MARRSLKDPRDGWGAYSSRSPSCASVSRSALLHSVAATPGLYAGHEKSAMRPLPPWNSCSGWADGRAESSPTAADAPVADAPVADAGVDTGAADAPDGTGTASSCSCRREIRAVRTSAAGTRTGCRSATKYPLRSRACTYPSASSWAYAFSTVTRLTPSLLASTRLEGRRCPGAASPDSMSARMQRYRYSYLLESPLPAMSYSNSVAPGRSRHAACDGLVRLRFIEPIKNHLVLSQCNVWSDSGLITSSKISGIRLENPHGAVVISQPTQANHSHARRHHDR